MWDDAVRDDSTGVGSDALRFSARDGGPRRMKGEPGTLALDGPMTDLGEHLARALAPPPSTQNVTLSPREREIARLIARGLPNKAIGAVLGISSAGQLRHICGACSPRQAQPLAPRWWPL
jgi:hypothetical protein